MHTLYLFKLLKECRSPKAIVSPIFSLEATEFVNGVII